MRHLPLAQLVGCAGFGLVLAVAAVALASRLTARRQWRGLAALAGAAVAALPVQGIPVAGYLRGGLGDLSITTVLMLAAALAATLTGHDLLGGRSRAALRVWAAAVGALLYPLTLGLTRFDPYELGFRPRVLVLVVAALAIWWWWRQRGAALILAAGVAAFNWHLLESGNLWDYLVDPVLAIWSLGALAWTAAGVMLRPRWSRAWSRAH